MHANGIRRIASTPIEFIGFTGLAFAYDWRACAVAILLALWMYWHGTADTLETLERRHNGKP